jgi:hypothetical protein
MPTKRLLGHLQRLWRDQVEEVKRILATREHVPKGPERKAKRLARSKRR